MVAIADFKPGRFPDSQEAWISHVRGAFSLVQHRGREQFQRSIGIRMLFRLCTSFLISCVVSHRPVPQELIDLRADLAKHVDSNNPKWRMMNIMVNFVELRRAYMDDSVPDEALIKFARRLEAQFASLAGDMPPSFHFDTVQLRESLDGVYGDYYHIYLDMHITQTCNVIRLTRILIKEMILNRRSKNLNSMGSLPAIESETLRKLATEICASVPQYTMSGKRTEESSPTSRGSARSTISKRTKDLPSSFECYTLIFPLYIVARSPYVDLSMRNWILVQLNFLSSEMGVRNAAEVVRVLEEKKGEDPWSVYVMLGSYAFVA